MRATLQGILALFFGGVVGGLLGSTLLRPAPAPEAGAAAPRPATPGRPGDERPSGAGPGSEAALARAIEDLQLELARLRAALDEPRPGSARTAAGEPAGADQERLIAVLEALARTLAAGGRSGAGGGPSGPLLVPQGPPRLDLLREIKAREDDERVRGMRFLTYQEVLDRFGEPDRVFKGGRWMYEDPDTGEEIEFHFEDGLLVNIY